MKTLEEAKQKVAQEDGYNYFENISDHLQEEYLTRAYELRMYEVAKAAHWKGCVSNNEGVAHWQTKSFDEWYDKEVRCRDFEWVCNECNVANLTSSVSEDEIRQELHCCINCGCFEMHKKYCHNS